MKKSILILLNFITTLAYAGFNSFEVKSFEIIKETTSKADQAYKGFLSAQSKKPRHSKMFIKLKNDKDMNIVLRGQYVCFSEDSENAFTVQSTVDVKFKDKKVKFSFENVIYAGETDGVDSSSPEAKKLELTKKCIKPMLDEYLKGINAKSDW